METSRVTRITPEIWAKLEQGRPTGVRLMAIRPQPELTDRLLCAIDSEGRRHLLLLMYDHDQPLRDRESRGLAVETRELGVHGEETRRYLDIECNDPAGYASLDIMGFEIAEGLARETQNAVPHELVRRLLAKWRRFWGHPPRAVMSRDELVGLFAELWFLSVWLVARVGTSEASQRWKGPFGGRHDFEWRRRSVEVKATTSTRGRIHTINGLDQLVPPEGGELFLFSMRLREEAGATNTLPTVVASARKLLEGDAESLDHFESGLARVGYSPAHDDDYAKIPLRIIDERLFAVRDDFPKLTAESFYGGVPPRIERIQYEINLASLDELCLAHSSSEASLMWWT